jgi:transcriptional regulator with GAF, ATPase, and Fis domain
METDFQTALSETLAQIVHLASAQAGTLIVADPQAAPSERIIAEAVQGIVDVNVYKRWLRDFFVENLPVPAIRTAPKESCSGIDRFHGSTPCPWAPGHFTAIEVSGRGLIRAFIFLSREQLTEISQSAMSAIVTMGNKCLCQFDEFVPSSAQDLMRRIGFVGKSGAFCRLAEQLKRIAKQVDAPVLITGERGAGKELAALAIHYYGPRRDKPFLAVNCAALHNDLYVAELFGYRKGAFTGAVGDRLGKFRSAEGGTLFLDEITEIPPTVSAGLLRALDHGEIQCLGYDQPIKVNVRILAATNRDIRRMVEENKFPADVFDRLNVLSVRVPPLREREEDIPVLVSYFCRKFCVGLAAEDTGLCKVCMETGRVECLEAQVLQVLKNYSWPGNIRELKNTVIKLITESEGGKIGTHHLPTEVANAASKIAGEVPSLALDTALRDHISGVLNLTRWNRSAAAKLLGLPLSTLVSKMKRLQITPP